MDTFQLTNGEKNLFELITQAIIANPFGDERTLLDAEISGISPECSYRERIEKVIEIVFQKVQNLILQKRVSVLRYKGRDAFLIRNALQFFIFHKYIPQFDQYILDQFAAGDQPLILPFAVELIDQLKQFDFTEGEIAHFLAFSFQIRRAFYFIRKSIVGCSLVMKELRKNLWYNVFTHNIDLYNQYLWSRMEDFSTLILGDTGTGKGTAASAIGRSGYIPFDMEKKSFVESFCRSFVSINLSQFPEGLIESELFGHKKGAFTGAQEDHKGILQLCSRYGSTFLDEIGEISIPLQIKLLQVIQERFFNPVGSHEKMRFQGRIIAATNQPLTKLRREKKFRDDFYYRLCSDVIIMPTLQERISEEPAELEDLIDYLTTKIVGQQSDQLNHLVKKVILKELGLDYHWPGNVRELEQCIRSVLLKNSYLPEKDLHAESMKKERVLKKIDNGEFTASQLLSVYCQLLYDRLGTFEEVAKRTELDWRTVKKYIQQEG
ncbi:MAG: sigma 54-interacting transcriptional regulator [Spirochaetes bacterium]|nr:sigma 54-interacting transcriptional regulator [Spirochaetota bacterium]